MIHQRQQNDCGIAAAAMVAGKSYSKARKVCGPVGSRDGLAVHEVQWLVEELTGEEWNRRRKSRATLATIAKSHRRAIVLGGYAFDECGHYYAIIDNTVICPTHGEADLETPVSWVVYPKGSQ